MRSVTPILKAGTSSFRYRCMAASVRHACNVIGTLPSPEINPIAAIIMESSPGYGSAMVQSFPVVEQPDEEGGRVWSKGAQEGVQAAC